MIWGAMKRRPYDYSSVSRDFQGPQEYKPYISPEGKGIDHCLEGMPPDSRLPLLYTASICRDLELYFLPLELNVHGHGL